MRSVAEYLEKAAEFDRLAAATENSGMRRRYMDVAKCYRLLAQERRGLIESGEIEPDSDQIN